MLSKAWIAFDKSAEDIRRLLDIHATLGGDARGRRHNLEVLNKSAVVLITAIWEAYCEDMAAEALDHIIRNSAGASSVPKELKKWIAIKIKEEKNDLAMWDLAADGWKTRAQSGLADLIARLNTPKSEKVDQLMLQAIGLKAVSNSWRWRRVSSEAARKKLDYYVSLRGSIAHGRRSLSVKKTHAEGYFDHVRLLVEMTGSRVNSFLKELTAKGLAVSPGTIKAKGYCLCGRNSCVGHFRTMPCGWRAGLSAWVIKKQLYWRCYDEKILCLRCRNRHKRGHVGRIELCGRPYRNQKRQTD